MKPILFLLFLSATCYGQQELTVLPIGLIDKNGVMDMNRYAPVSEVNSALQTAQAATTTANNATNRVAALEVKVNSLSGGIVAPVFKSGNYTIQLSDHGATIYMNCTCTLTIPPLQAGFKAWVQSSGGTVKLSYSGVNRVTGSPSSLSINQRPVMIDYKDSKTVNVR